MSQRKIKLFLFGALLTATVLPLLAALYLLDHSVRTSLALGFNPQIGAALEHGSENLLTLKRLDPERASAYRQQFESVEELRHVYASADLLRGSVSESLRIYFLVGSVAAIALSLLVAGWLSRRIAHAYSQTFQALIAERDKVRYLEEMASWQRLARMLAHEIKNPLTPIEVLVSSLPKAHERMSPPEFRQHLDQTREMVGDELQHLQRTVARFADFARLPEADLIEADVASMLNTLLPPLQALFPKASIALRESPELLTAKVDATLLRQALANLVRNGVEANPDRNVHFQIQVSQSDSLIEIAVANDGAPVPEEIASNMFDPYVSARRGTENMGLGLAIVKKIALDHKGEVRHECIDQQPRFVLSIPRSL